MLKAKEIINEAYKSDICILNAQKPLVDLAAHICVMHETKMELIKQGLAFNSIPKFVPLVIAESGVGKTYILENIIGKHFETILLDCSRITPPGYKGYNLENAIVDLFERIATDAPVIILDEIDKLIEQPYGKTPSTSAQPSFLKLLESDLFRTKDSVIDISKASFVMCGAFSKIKEKKEQEKKFQIGFGVSKFENTIPCDQSLRNEIISYGILPEIANRISNIVYIPAFSKEDYKSLLDSSNQTSALNKQKTIFALHGVELFLSKSASEKIITEAYHCGSAGRAIDGILQKYINEALLKVSNSNKINKVIIDIENEELVVKYSFGKRTTDLYLKHKNYERYLSYDLKKIYKNNEQLLDFSSYLVSNFSQSAELKSYIEPLKYYFFFTLFGADNIVPFVSFESLMNIKDNIEYLKNNKEDILALIKTTLKIDDEKYYNNLESKYYIMLHIMSDHSTVIACKRLIDSILYDFHPKQFKELQDKKNTIFLEK